MPEHWKNRKTLRTSQIMKTKPAAVCLAAASLFALFACATAARAVIATKISDFADGAEPPKNIYHPNTGVFTPNNGFISQTDSTTGELAGITRLTLRFRNTGVDASNPWWDNDRTTTSTDRQRSEVKGITSKSYDQKPGETYEYSVTWRSSPGILITNQFFHFFQIKGVDGSNGSPLVVMSITSSSTVQVRYTSPGVSGFINVISGKNIPFTPNTWQTITIRVTPCSKSDGSTSDGSIYVSVNGEPFWGSSGLKLYCASTTSYHSKFGMYRGISGGTSKLNDAYIQHLYPSQNKYIAGATPTPAITSITPTSAAVGDTLTITGTNLKATTANIITIGGAAATITSNDGATLTATVPATATNDATGPGIGSGYIVLRNDNGTAVAPQKFTLTTVTPAPNITDVSLASATTAKPGDTITLTGANLSNATVTLDNAMATITSTSSDGKTLQFTVPAGIVNGAILVTTPGGSVTAPKTLDVGQPAPPPGILIEAEDLFTTGQYTLTTNAGSLSTGNDTTASGGKYVSTSSGAVGATLTFTLPAITQGVYNLIIGNKTNSNRGIVQLKVDNVNVGDPWDLYAPSGASAMVSKDYGNIRLTAGPHTISMTVIGHTASGYTIGADYFRLIPNTTPPLLMLPDDMTIATTDPAGATVTFNATAIDAADGGPATITCTPASGSLFPIGVTTVTAEATDCTGNKSTDTFTITVYTADPGTPDATPTVTDITPTKANPGDTITIIGTNLTDATVTIGGAIATVVPNDDGTTLTVTVPASATNSTIIITTNAGSVTDTQTLTLTAAPPPPVDPALTVDKIMLTLAQPANSPDTFSLTTNIPWITAISPTTATWLACEPNAGPATGAAPATLTAKALTTNTTGAPRTASLLVTGGGLTRTLIATQAATNIPGLAPAAPLPAGAILTLTLTGATPRAYTIATGTTLTTPDAAGPLTLDYEYAATGSTATLILPYFDSVYSLQFTTTAAGALTLYTFDDTGPYNHSGAFTYAAPAAPPPVTYNLTLYNATATPAAPSYEANAKITLTADAPAAGKIFDQWTTSAGGSFTTLTTPTTTFTMPANATIVIANYKPQPATNGNNNTGGNSSGGGGGGGGGAPTLWYFAALAVLAAARKQKNSKSQYPNPK